MKCVAVCSRRTLRLGILRGLGMRSVQSAEPGPAPGRASTGGRSPGGGGGPGGSSGGSESTWAGEVVATGSSRDQGSVGSSESFPGASLVGDANVAPFSLHRGSRAEPRASLREAVCACVCMHTCLCMCTYIHMHTRYMSVCTRVRLARRDVQAQGHGLSPRLLPAGPRLEEAGCPRGHVHSSATRSAWPSSSQTASPPQFPATESGGQSAGAPAGDGSRSPPAR